MGEDGLALRVPVSVEINGESYEVVVEPYWTLLDLLRDELGLTGTKKGCNEGACGTCTVLLNGRTVLSCLIFAVQANEQKITTIEGLESAGELHPVQRAFIEYDGLQCGFCTPGQIMSAKSLLDSNPHPSEDDVRKALAGNICRCGCYNKIVEAVLAASKAMSSGEGTP